MSNSSGSLKVLTLILANSKVNCKIYIFIKETSLYETRNSIQANIKKHLSNKGRLSFNSKLEKPVLAQKFFRKLGKKIQTTSVS